MTLAELLIEPGADAAYEADLRDAALLEGVTPEILQVLYSCTATFGDDPAATPNPNPYADYFTWVKARERLMQPQIELIDLVHVINRPEQRRQALSDWQAHLNDGWKTVDITTLLDQDGFRVRIVVLERECPPVPAPSPLTASAAVEVPLPATLQPAQNFTVTIHPPITLERSTKPSLNTILDNHPIAAHIRQHGVEATLEAMNSRVRDAGRAAYNERLKQHQHRPFTRIPLLP